MPRNYKRRLGARNYRNYTLESLQQAVRDYQNHQGSLEAIGEKYGIPAATLYRKVKHLHQKSPGGQTILSTVDESAIVKSIALAADWGFPLECDDIRDLVKSYLNRRGLTVSIFRDNMPGREWYLGFLARHKDVLSSRLSQAIKQSRAKISPRIINQYFDNLTSLLRNVEPEAIVNYDETNFTDDPGRVKVVVRRRSKRAEKIMDSSKAATSVMFSVSASGKMLPIYVVYKADHVWSSWMENGPPKARYNRSKSGWFDTNLFEEWFVTVALPYFNSLPEGPKILIGDNLASHISVQVISLCAENNIQFVLLPPNSTHLTQPLDVSVFRPIKNAWRKILRIWKRSNRGVVRKDVFPRLLNQALNSIDSQNAANIRSGFESTGISPVCREKILKKLPKEVPSEREAETSASDALKELFQQARYGTSATPKGRRKKLDVQPGKSIALEDIAPNPQKSDDATKKDNSTKPGPSNPSKQKAKKKTRVRPESETEEEEDWDEFVERKRPRSRRFSDNTSDDESVLFESDKENSPLSATIAENEETEKTDQDEPENSSSDYQENDFVIVELKSAKNISKKFVAKIVDTTENDSFVVSYLRAHSKIECTYIFPPVQEESLVDKREIIRKLQSPTILRRGSLKFPGLQL